MNLARRDLLLIIYRLFGRLSAPSHFSLYNFFFGQLYEKRMCWVGLFILMAFGDVTHELVLPIVPGLTMLRGIAQKWLILFMPSFVIIFVSSSGIDLVTVLTFIIILAYMRFHVNAEAVFVLVNIVAVDCGTSRSINTQRIFAYHF
jgi:hypothetical protein